MTHVYKTDLFTDNSPLSTYCLKLKLLPRTYICRFAKLYCNTEMIMFLYVVKQHKHICY
jgi:hypothetical protein